MSDPPAGYRDRIAAVYDGWYARAAPWAEMDEPEHAVAALAALAAGGSVLELGSATGTFALALAERGLDVRALEWSPAMIARMRAKPGGAAIEVIERTPDGEPPAGSFALVYAVRSALFWLGSQDAQARCFANAARVLAPGGVFVVEAGLPDVSRFDRGQRIEVRAVEPDRVVLLATIHDPLDQVWRSQFVVLSQRGTELYPLELRYAWPSELDAMAELAGLRLRERRPSFAGGTFTGTGTGHVSIYACAPPQQPVPRRARARSGASAVVSGAS
jgi:SAM-dependent methyltransferase